MSNFFTMARKSKRTRSPSPVSSASSSASSSGGAGAAKTRGKGGKRARGSGGRPTAVEAPWVVHATQAQTGKAGKAGKASKRGAALAGYGVLRLPLPTQPAVHCSVYVRRHVERKVKLPAGGDDDDEAASADSAAKARPDASLFIVNVREDMSDDYLERVFATAGTVTGIERTTLKHAGAQPVPCARVSFEEESELQNALTLAVQGEEIMEDGMESQLPPVEAATPLETWWAKYQEERPGAGKLKRAADEHVSAYEAEQSRLAAIELANRNKMDADGFIKVTRRSKGTHTDGVVHVRATKLDAEQLEARKKRDKEKQKSDFYRFQHRERKRDEIAVLREKFQADREKISRMREERKFRPF